MPLLMIDDESDYASVDTKKQDYDNGIPDPDHDPTKINGWIRKILRAFAQSVYIGYTATPFANIFIPESGRADAYENDLFPRSFIFNLPAPSNYIGPDKMFGLDDDGEELPIFTTVEDHADSDSLVETEGWMPPRHSKNHSPLYMGEDRVPPSLRTAILSFILATAARKARGQRTSHNSMLIHVTRFVDVQERVKRQVEHEFFAIRDRIVYGDGDRESILDELQSLWSSDFLPKSSSMAEPGCLPLQWSEVLEALPETVHSIVVRKINGSSGDILEYTRRSGAGQAFDVIAIGGDKLSRGLTLEGLTVSYFLRHSKMYDTLMQMGRWFGYRPGYVDMCRIYTTAELRRWFRHISIASEELRQDFNRMVLSGCTPRQFGHRVVNHPQMMVTSPTKMRYTETRTNSYQGLLSVITLYSRKPADISNNLEAFRKLLTSLDRTQPSVLPSCAATDGRLLYKDISPDLILQFLEAYRGHPAATKVRPEYLSRYIRDQNVRGHLTDWSVLVAKGQGDKFEVWPGLKFNAVIRSWYNRPPKVQPGDPYRVKTVGSPRDEFADMPEDGDEYRRALQKSVELWEIEGRIKKRPDVPQSRAIRMVRPPARGLLCIYPIVPDDCPEIDEPLIGVLASFPNDEDAIPFQYKVNEVYVRQEQEGFWDE